MTVFFSKSSASGYERDMYLPFAGALNEAFEQLSGIQVDGLPDFKTHIAFVPCDKGVPSNRDTSGSKFKPDIALMPIQDARKLYGLDQPDAPAVSEFISEIRGKISSEFTGWDTILSAVEIKRKGDMSGWASLDTFYQPDRQVSVIPGVDRRLDEIWDDSQPTTRKISFCHRGTC